MGSIKTPIVGTELKIRVGVTSGNKNWKDLDSDHPSDFTLQFYVGDFASAQSASKVVTITGEAPTDVPDGTYLALVDTAVTGAGTLMLRVTLDEYDADYEDEPLSDESTGYRREIATYNTGIKVYNG